MPKIDKPRLVNRGPAGLLSKKAGTVKAETKAAPKKELPNKINNIVPALTKMIVPLEQLVMDPQNARLHPERNLEAIKDSLKLYGQVKPVVVRKATNVVVAGNGTMEAAKALGWTQLAASFVDMNEIEATGYGLADNRTAELAKWDFEVVARLDKLLQEQAIDIVGWSQDELEVLRMADWTPPPIDDSDGDGTSGDAESLLISFTPDQYEVVGAAINAMRQIEENPALEQDKCLEKICKSWLEKE